MKVFWYLWLVLITLTVIGSGIFLLKWYGNKDYSVSTRKALNWSYFFFFGINIMPLAMSYAQSTPDILFIVYSAIGALFLWVLAALTYSGYIERRYFKKKGLGIISIAPRFECPSDRQIKEQKAYETMTDEEKEAFYNEYCKNNKLLNPIIAVSLLVISYGIELYLYIPYYLASTASG